MRTFAARLGKKSSLTILKEVEICSSDAVNFDR